MIVSFAMKEHTQETNHTNALYATSHLHKRLIL